MKPQLCLTLAAMLVFADKSNAVTVPGTDNANQAAYDDGWQTGDDGAASGNGFSGWFVAVSGGISGHFIGNSANLAGGAGANINVNGESFGMYGGTGSQADAYRWFVESDGATHTTLGVGQSFSIDIAVNFRNGYKGLDLRDGSDTTFFNFNIGGDDYVVGGSGVTSGGGSIGNAYSNNTAFHLTFTQTSIGGGTWQIARSGGVTDFDNGTYFGAAGSFKLYVGGTDGGSSNDFFANNLVLIPEPGAAALLSGGLALLFGMSRARRREL